MGNAGPDKGKGGKFLLLPPDYKGAVPDRLFRVTPQDLWQLAGRTRFHGERDPSRPSTSIKTHLRIYPLSQASTPPETTFINGCGKAFNTIHAMDFSFFDEVNKVVQEEPAISDGSGNARPARRRSASRRASRSRRMHE